MPTHTRVREQCGTHLGRADRDRSSFWRDRSTSSGILPALDVPEQLSTSAFAHATRVSDRHEVSKTCERAFCARELRRQAHEEKVMRQPWLEPITVKQAAELMECSECRVCELLGRGELVLVAVRVVAGQEVQPVGVAWPPSRLLKKYRSCFHTLGSIGAATARGSAEAWSR